MTVQSIGIDVSKRTLDVALYSTEKEFTSYVFENTQEGIILLEKTLVAQKTAFAVPCVVESTGMYHLPVSLMLKEHGRRVNCINPIITKAHQISSVRKTKTDKIDAQRLAYIGIIEPKLPEFDKQTKDIYVKRIIRMVATLDKEIQRLKLAVKSFEELVETLHLPKEHCASLRDLVKSTEKQKERLIEDLVTLIPQAEKLSETKGVSRETSAILLGSLSGAQFISKDALVAFVGLDVSVRQSGTFRGRGKLSKRGNAFTRKVLHQMAWGLKQHNDVYREYYESLRLRNLHYTTCLNAVARKFLRRLYAQFDGLTV